MKPRKAEIRRDGKLKVTATEVPDFNTIVKYALQVPTQVKRKATDFSKAIENWFAQGLSRPIIPSDTEDCVGCRFIWSQLENDVGLVRIQAEMAEHFQTRCNQAKTTPIFYPVCAVMLEYFDDMLVSYMAGLNVEDICELHGYCRKKIPVQKSLLSKILT